MTLKITVVHRIIALSTAVTIGYFLWQQIDENGFSDAPWLISIIFISALLGFSLVGFPIVGISSSRTTHLSKTSIKITVDQAFDSCINRFSRFYDDLLLTIERKDILRTLKTNKAILTRMASYMITLIVFQKKINGFRSTISANKLRNNTVRVFRDILWIETKAFESLMDSSIALPDGQARALTDANVIADQCERAVDECIRLFGSDSAYPMDPAYLLLNRLVGVADNSAPQRDHAYGPTARSLFQMLDSRHPAEIDFGAANVAAPPNALSSVAKSIDGLLDDAFESAKVGEKPESMLIPTVRIKLDIILAAFAADKKKLISELLDQRFSKDEIEIKIAEIQADVTQMEHALKRESSHRVEQLFAKMYQPRSDAKELEARVRLENPHYKAVPPLII